MKNILFFAICLCVLMCAINTTIAQQQQYSDDHYFPLPDAELETVHSEKMSFQVQTVVSGLSIPWGAAFLPDGKIVITERGGTMKVVENGQLRAENVSGVPAVFARGQGGLLDIVAHPDYEENGWLYFCYSIPGDGGAHTAVARARLAGNALEGLEVLFEGEPKTQRWHHFGCRIAFDRDNYMFFAIGDRGQWDNAQDMGNHSGKTFRLYDDGRVPQDNPFVNTPGAKPEIYTIGNRNIQGMATHPETGEIWSHEHGPMGGDEINIIRRGLNYGWPKISHGINYDGSIITPDTAAAGLKQPLHHWTPSIAPSGMAIVHGDRYPAWNGNVLTGALRPMFLNRSEIDLENERVTHEERLLQGIGRVRDVRLAPDGFIYVLEESNGRMLRIIPVK